MTCKINNATIKEIADVVEEFIFTPTMNEVEQFCRKAYVQIIISLLTQRMLKNASQNS